MTAADARTCSRDCAEQHIHIRLYARTGYVNELIVVGRGDSAYVWLGDGKDQCVGIIGGYALRALIRALSKAGKL